MTNTYKVCLLLEDDPEDREFFLETLEKVSVQTGCYAVSNGEEGLSVLLEKKVRPDVIFTDIDMPRMNGIEFIRQLRCIDLFRGIPVVIYSSSCLDRDRFQLQKLGVSAFYSKLHFHALPQILSRYFPSNFDHLRTIL